MAESILSSTPDQQTSSWPATTHGDFTIHDFPFDSGETLPALRLHYQTLGHLRSTADGRRTNAVLILHGTGGSGDNFLNAQFAGALFNAGQLLDAARYFIILRDGIGHGRSSRPSTTGLRTKFPAYVYADMVRADHRLLTEHLGIRHLRLVMGTSMGGMHTWLWGGAYPGLMDALMPLASLPVPIAGRNRMWRHMVADLIRSDPVWLGGDYPPDAPPTLGLTAAVHLLILMGSAPLPLQREAPTRDAADRWLEARVRAGLEGLDANDLLYALDASRDYDPRPGLGNIRVPLTAVNSADDQINPPELDILGPAVEEGMREGLGRTVVLPITEDTRGHGSHSIAKLWKGYLEELLERSEGERGGTYLDM
ncbi:homoserine acetyltransferase [Xylariomycetidae sp. FL2044]|nr:homoserine acetyltransferase [Xylariomycetidae sp. FL2044]